MEFVILVYSWSYLYGFVQNSLQYLYPNLMFGSKQGRSEAGKEQEEF